MNNVYVLSYRWLDLQDEGNIAHEYYRSLDEALMAREAMFADEVSRQQFDPNAIGQFEITIDRFTFDNQISKGRV